jgi:hypothetical protein
MHEAANSEETAPPKRRAGGRPFVKGQSGNPKGRPKGVASAARELIGDDPTQLLRVFLNVARNTKAKPTDRITAAKEYLDRAYGKAPAYALIEGEDPLALGSIDREIADVLDELAARREAKAPGESIAGAVEGSGADGAAAAGG